MSVIAPTVTAYDSHEYRRQMEAIVPFAKRIHVDLMDGVFAPTKSPDIDKIWLPGNIPCDIHIMFQHPGNAIRKLLQLKPHAIIVQAEANPESVLVAQQLLDGSAVRFGVSLLATTDPLDKRYVEAVRTARHILVFSGKLGYHGGTADLGLLDKVQRIKELNPRAEIGWDGGISLINVSELVAGGVDVLNVGGYVQKSDDPEKSYKLLQQALA